MRLLGNILWFILGGLAMAIAWFLIGLIACVTIVGIPWGRSCFVLGQFSAWPFGREAVNRHAATGRADIGTGAAGTIGNVIWFLLAGIWLALGHLISAVACFITIIGIPFGLQHLKLCSVALAPIGKTIVTVK